MSNKTNNNQILIDDINKLLFHIEAIVNSFKVDLKREETIVRVEEFHRYDNKLIVKTLRDPKLFTIVNEEVSPKKLHSYDYEENVDIYENRFIASLLFALKNEIEDSYFRSKNTSLTFLKTGISFGEYGTYQILDKFAKNSFKLKDNDLNILKNLIQKIDLLLKRDFFRKVKLISLSDVSVTNTLIGDEDYFYCFNFYKKGLAKSKNYKLILIEEFKKLLKIDEEATELIYKKNDFIYNIDLNEPMSITLENLTLNKKVIYSFDIRVGLFSNYFLLKLEGNESKIPIENASGIIEILNSLSLEVSFKETTCPVCLKDNEEVGFCRNCKAKYFVYQSNKEKRAWVYNAFEILVRNN